MSNTVISTSLIGWANNITASPYIYGVFGGLLLVILLGALWLLFRKPKSKTNTAPSASKRPVVSTQQPQGNSSSLIYEKITSLKSPNKSILLAGAGLEYLPVTIPVQTAIRLAQAGKKVLLIDLDTKRNAAARAFDLNENTVKNCTSPKPLSTLVANLSLWPAEFFVRFGQINLRSVIQSAENCFDLILINAPYLDGHLDRKPIASSAKCGFIFCKTTQQFDRLRELMAQSQCQLLEEKPLCG
jgi:Mrp family chromosome partitioning ATPase